MVHDERHRQRQQARQQFGQHRAIHMQAQMPAQRRDQRDHVIEHSRIGRAAQVRHEIEPRRAHAALVQLPDAGFGRSGAQQRNAAIAAAALRQRVQQGAMVSAMAIGLHHHGALHAQARMQRRHPGVRRVRRRIRPALRIREYVAWSEDMTMRVACARRQRMAGTGRGRKRGTAIGHGQLPAVKAPWSRIAGWRTMLYL
ncbi:hypothetical protein D3C72_1643550 [compost metagenome]